MKIFPVMGMIFVITENIDGEKYIFTASNVQEVLADWNDECDFCPSNDAPVYFTMFNGKIVEDNKVKTFEDLVEYIQGE